MGFLTRLIAGLVSAATLGMGVAGTTPAVADTSTKTTGTVETTTDTTTNLPDHLVNSDFEYLPDGGWKTINARYDMVSAYTSVDPVNGQYMRNAIHSDSDTGTAWVDWPGFDQSKFAWRTDQKGGHDQGGLKDRAEAVELQQDSTDGNTYAEMVASETGRTIYQDLKTIPGTLYKIRLKHASLCKDNVDQMQVVINGQPIEMTRVTSNGHGDQVGEKSTTISTKVTNENRWHHSDQWETYEGYYIIPDGQTTTRFGFKAVNYLDPTKGNLLDDVTFARAYKLTYDKNASDASGSVPANERGKENTVQPAKAETTGSVRTVADDTSGLPDHLVNGDFQTYGNEIINKRNRSALSNYLTFVDGEGNVMKDSAGGAWVKLDGWDASKFAWKSNDSVGAHSSIVELQRSKNSPTPASSGNVWGEIAAATKGKYIYQDIATTPGTMYKWSIKHASRNTGSDDSMQVMIGEPGKETAQQATRDTSNGSDSTGSVGTTITTHGTAQDGQWETYSGTYIATGTVTRFTFKSMVDSNHSGGTDTAEGNCIDDVMFTKAYKLSYDKNASDATGSIPSDETAGTVKQAKAKTATNGTVSLASDTTKAGLPVHDLKNGEIAPAQYGDFRFSTVKGFTADQVTDVNGFTVKTNWDPAEENQAYASVLATMYQPDRNGASLVLHHVGQWRDSSGTQRWLNAKVTVNGQNLGTLVYIPSTRKFVASYGKWDKHSSSRPYLDVTVDFLLDDGSTPQGLRGVTGFTDLDGGTSGYNEGVELVSGFDGAYVRSDAHLTRFGTNGWAGNTDENENDADEHGMKHYVGATFTGSSFRVRWSAASGQARQSGFQPVDSTIAYRLTYDKNADDASGRVPSNTAADTTQAVASRTDGTVKSLVQRTTTHEDGSVTVRTVDSDTDVVQGCQVYYPAGQRITLATMAKDGDCWDSGMLTRPGHTQLGWNQDRDATAAQSEVTMVEGGMTVYAVWTGNPTLTYDTNKPDSWNGEMPSTPASVSVPYNTAATDGSGWTAGDTSKLRGYRFLGWYSTPQDGSNLYDWNTPLTANTTVYAHWERLRANVLYDANGGEGSHEKTAGWQYSDVTVPADTSKSFTRDGYEFLGWNTQKDGKGTDYADGSQVPLQDTDVTLYAQWRPVHTVLNPTGGVGLPLLLAGGGLLMLVGIGATVRITRRRPDDGASVE